MLGLYQISVKIRGVAYRQNKPFLLKVFLYVVLFRLHKRHKDKICACNNEIFILKMEFTIIHLHLLVSLTLYRCEHKNTNKTLVKTK